ncbi:MAG TPA: TonB-dependent receptor, partial [Candidatus Acidoferrum sp.]|nr:TonB-dependent receptor [Candidatus Acidoferrum sp.]
MRLNRVGVFALFIFCAVFAVNTHGQSLISGDITGTLTDPSGAIVPNASVTVKSVDTGATNVTTTTTAGAYRFSLLKPGQYVVEVNLAGFTKIDRTTTVEVGQTSVINISLSIAKGAQTVEVTGAAPVITPSASENTTFSQLETQLLPNAGGDITNVADTAPGVSVNNAGGMMGYGNFTVNGLPGTSNLFTVNGENDMDPYFNISNSGATNLNIGSNELQELTVVSNPYDAQYGQLAGAQISYVTKSGTNDFHGDANWYWNGREMNSNDWLNKDSGGTRPFSNANQWAANIGGPIRRNSTFFFVDTEGLKFVLPNVDNVTIPTPAFASAVLANVASLEPNEASTYTKMFGLWAATPNASAAQPVPNNDACNGLSLPGFDPTTQNCAQSFVTTPVALASEWMIVGRLDQRIGSNDTMFFRWKTDHGVQPTSLDPVSSNFDAISNQPEYDAQLNETHVFGPNATNSLTATLQHYVAQFTQSQPLASDTFGWEVTMAGQMPFSSFNSMSSFPQGRNITQYQFIDDFTWSHGRHNLHFGEDFRRYDVSDHNFFFTYPRAYFSSLQEFVDGLALEYEQADNIANNVPVAMWGIGAYVQDDWNVKSNLKLTLGLRAERSSNPVCQINCFANFVSPAASLPSFTAGTNAGNIPYNKDIIYGLHSAYHGTDIVDWSPRIGFSWSPGTNNSLVLSGGFGIFPDSPAAGLVDNLLADPPNSVTLRVKGTASNPTGGALVFDTTPGGAAAAYAASAAAFNSGFRSGQTYNQISSALLASGVDFAAPGFTSLNGTIKAPLYYEWNFQVQKEITSSTAFQVDYIGNHGSRILYSNGWANAWDTGSQYGLPNGLYNGLVPQSVPVPNYANVTQYQNGGISNYNGVTFTLRHVFSHWVTGHLNYTYSHALDDVSNGGIFAYNFGDVQDQICPGSLAECNYGNSDYDIRHLISGDFVVSPTFHVHGWGLRELVNGWQYSGKLFWHTGIPFSVTDDYWAGVVTNGGSSIFAQPIAGSVGQPSSCGSANASPFGTAASCLNAAAFVDSTSASFTGYTAFSNQERNQYRGPHYFDMDMQLF